MGRQLCLSARLRSQVIGLRREQRYLSSRLRSHDIDKLGHATYILKSFEHGRQRRALTKDPSQLVKPRLARGLVRGIDASVTQRGTQRPEVLLVLVLHEKPGKGTDQARTVNQYAAPSVRRRLELLRRAERRQAPLTKWRKEDVKRQCELQKALLSTRKKVQRWPNMRIARRAKRRGLWISMQRAIRRTRLPIGNWHHPLTYSEMNSQQAAQASRQALAASTNLRVACHNFSKALGQLDQRSLSGDRRQSHKAMQDSRKSFIRKRFEDQPKDLDILTSSFIQDILRDLGLPDIVDAFERDICSQKANALPDASNKLFVGILQRLAQDIGPRSAFTTYDQAAVAVPRLPATPSHDHDSPEPVAAFDSEGANLSVWDDVYKSYTPHLSQEIQTLLSYVQHFLEDAALEIDLVLRKTWSYHPRIEDTQVKNSEEERLVFKESTTLYDPVPRKSTGRLERQQENRELVQERLVLQRDKHETDSKPATWNQAIGRERQDPILRMIRAKARIPIRKVVGRESSMAYKAKATPSSPEIEEPEQTTILSSPSDLVAEQLDDDLEFAESTGIPRTATVGNAFKPSTPKQAALNTAMIQDAAEEVDEEDVYVPLTYQIPEEKMIEALDASPSSNLAYWSYDKYRSPDGASISLHYCKKVDTSEKVANLFLGKPIIGCDIEWKPSAKEVHGMKANVSLIQIASEDRIALFHIAVHNGDKPEDVLAPTLKQILESSDVMKCGVAIGSDFTRMQKHLGIETNSIFELSHLHKLVSFGNTHPKLVNKKLVSLTSQAQSHLGLPLYKGEERVSDWSQSLNMKQCKYAADDAYASYRIFEALKEKWYKMEPRPPFPACAELGLPIQLAPQPDSESSESDNDSFIVDSSADEEAGTLQKNIARLDIDDTASVDSYGENAFDSLTEEQLRTLELQVDHSLDNPPVQAMKVDAVSDDTVRYPVLPLEYDEPKSYFVGRLGLQPRLRAPSGRHNNISQDTVGETQLPEQPEDDLDAITEAKTDIQPIDDAHKELSVEATLWAQEMAQLKSAAGSSKSKSNLTVAALRAYYLWEQKKLESKEVAKVLRDPPLKIGTVAAYVAECVQFGSFEWTDASRLKALVKEIPPQARVRYKRIMQVAADAASQ